jgi:hypothetical protein
VHWTRLYKQHTSNMPVIDGSDCIGQMACGPWFSS